MKKIKYRIVYNRKKRLDSQGKALVQVEAYLLGKKAYFSTHIYIKPDQWNSRKSIPHGVSEVKTATNGGKNRCYNTLIFS